MNKLSRVLAFYAGVTCLAGSALAQTESAPQITDPAAGQQPTAEKQPAKTEITATEGATADLKNRTATFSGDVRVIDPRFQMKTRSLSVLFSKEPAGLERAIASGGVVIIQMQTDGKKSDPAVGKAERAVYEASTGDIELSGYPTLEQGLNRHVATSAGTRMILNREGNLRTIGPSKTEIIDRNQSSLPGSAQPR